MERPIPLNEIITPMEEDLDEDQLDATTNLVYIDIQGFPTRNNKFICKEFCLVDGEFIYHALVKSPYKFNKLPSEYKRQANWLMQNHHGLSFDCGDIPIVELIQKVFPMIQKKKVIAKGVSKVMWIQYMFRNCGPIECINIENIVKFNISASRQNKSTICKFHSRSKHLQLKPCAMLYACSLQDILNEHFRLRNVSADDDDDDNGESLQL